MAEESKKIIHYFAPLEGITGYLYRNIHHKYYPVVDTYFAPFISPTPDCIMQKRDRRNVLPENNQGFQLVPQILVNRGETFIPTAKALQEMGYTEVNLNLGCPSGTVTAKGKGSGFLRRLDELDQCLDEIFSGLDMDISIKTRIGYEDYEDWSRIMEIYNKYPMKELIIHPRIRKEFYNGLPHMDAFATAVDMAKMPICYNGDIYEQADQDKILTDFPSVDRIMIGRGYLRNPAGIDAYDLDHYDWKKLKEFHDELYYAYRDTTSSDKPSLHKMKELWIYMQVLFEDLDGFPKMLKRIRKADRHETYMAEVDALWQKRMQN